jgi:hypothetical protein
LAFVDPLGLLPCPVVEFIIITDPVGGLSPWFGGDDYGGPPPLIYRGWDILPAGDWPANKGTNCTPLTKGCSNVPTAEQQCIGDFYNSPLGKAAAFGSPLALLPGWNPQWGSTMGDWAEAIVGKGGGIFGTGAAGTSGTAELTTLSGTRFVGSTLELWTGTVLGAIEKAAPPAMLAATVLDISAHAQCSALPGGALTTPSEGMFGAIP